MFTKEDVQGKRVLLAADMNEKAFERGGFRILAILPTIEKLLDWGAKQVGVLSHFGRPKGVDSHYALGDHAKVISDLLESEVGMDPADENGYRIFHAFRLLVLENLRFFDWEKTNTAKILTKHFDILVYEAFGLCHRDKPYTTGLISTFGEGRVFSGSLLNQEIHGLEKFLSSDLSKDLVLGGKKLGDKIPVLEAMLPKVEKVYIVGAVVNAFFKAQGKSIGKSFCDLTAEDGTEISLETIQSFLNSGKIILPDQVFSNYPENGKLVKPFPSAINIQNQSVSENLMIVDINPRSYDAWNFTGKAVFWNGNAGITERGFEKGTVELAKLITEAKLSIAGGGDTVKWLSPFTTGKNSHYDIAKKFSHISTGGGASLEFLALDGKLPVLEALRKVQAL